MLQAGNGTNTAADRVAIAQQLRSVRDSLLGIANRPDGTGGDAFNNT
jgi:flagellar hook-associated protein 3 FlgL